MMNIRRSIRRLARQATESEKAIEAYLVRKAEEAGGLCLKFSSHTQVGYPDRLLLMPGGHMAWVELKSKGERPRRIQEVRMASLRRLGFTVHVADSREMVDEIVRATAMPRPTKQEDCNGV